MNLAQALAARDQRGVRNPSTTLLGWVVSSTSTTVTVDLGEQTVTMPKVRDYASPAANDVVLVIKTGRLLYCIGAVNAAPVVKPPADPEVPPPPASNEVRTRSFRPVSVGTYRGGWRGDTGDVLQGDWSGHGVNQGAAYYGSGPAGLTGTAVSGTVRVKRLAGGVSAPQSPTFRLLDHKRRPAGAPSFSDTFAGPAIAIGDTRAVALPTAWVTALINGTAGGIGIGVAGSSPYIRLAGRGAWAPSFELTIKWKD